MTIVVALTVFIIWTAYRLFLPENILLDELIFKPAVWLVPVLLVTRFQNLGFNTRNLRKNILIGLAVGLVLPFERILVNQLKFEFNYTYIVSAIFTAFTEEIFFRGYLLNRSLKYFKNPFVALIVNGLFFTSTHIPIAIFRFHYLGYDLFTYLLTNFVSGFVNIFLYYFTGSIFAPIANHFVWNVFSGLFK